jgi:hypothetical protein
MATSAAWHAQPSELACAIWSKANVSPSSIIRLEAGGDLRGHAFDDVRRDAPAPTAPVEEVFPRADKFSARDRRSAEARAIEQKRLAAVAARTADLPL